MTYFSWSLDLSVINCKIEPALSWSKTCVISEIPRTAELVNPIIPAIATTSVISVFQVNNTKPYVPVCTLSIKDYIKFLESLKLGFKEKKSWNKYRSEITTQQYNNNLNYMTDPAFRNFYILFFLSLKNGNNNSSRELFNKYYMRSTIFDQRLKQTRSIWKTYQNVKNRWLHKGNFYLHYQKYYKHIQIDLSRYRMFSLVEKQQETILKFSLDLLYVAEWYKQERSRNNEIKMKDSKDEATNFNAGIVYNNNNFACFSYKIKSADKAEAQPAPNNADEISKYTATVVPLNYWRNFWKSLEMPLIIYKVQLKLQWKKHWILASAGANNADADSDNTCFTIKRHKIICLCSPIISKKQSKTIKTS